MADTELTLTQQDELKDRVQAGAEFLDDYQPGWAINLTDQQLVDLDISHCTKCVLGSIFGAYYNVVRHNHKPYTHKQPLTQREAVKYGFNIYSEDDELWGSDWYNGCMDDAYKHLRELWIQQIENRIESQELTS